MATARANSAFPAGDLLRKPLGPLDATEADEREPDGHDQSRSYRMWRRLLVPWMAFFYFDTFDPLMQPLQVCISGLKCGAFSNGRLIAALRLCVALRLELLSNSWQSSNN